MTLPSNGRWGGNWMNPEPTTRWGFYVRIEKEVKVSRLIFVAIEHSCSVITLKTRGEKTPPTPKDQISWLVHTPPPTK